MACISMPVGDVLTQDSETQGNCCFYLVVFVVIVLFHLLFVWVFCFVFLFVLVFGAVLHFVCFFFSQGLSLEEPRI